MTICNGYLALSPVVWIVLLCTKETVAASKWPSAFASTTWLDNTRGTLTFTNSTLSLTMTLYGVTHSTWDCVDNSSSSLLVMKSQSTIPLTVGGFTFQFSVYLCLDLVQITSVSYYYYQRHEVQPTFGYERVHVDSSSSITSSSQICNFTVSIPTAEFHVIVKSGNASNAKVTCPSGIIGKYDYVYYPKDASAALCNSSKDTWDGCTDKTTITFNYTTCSQQIAYSAGGVVWCVANIGDTYGVVYNNDSSLVSNTNDKLATYRFSCIVGNHASASIAPGNCTSQQTATSYPLKWNSINQVNENAGVYLTLSPYYTCGGSTQSSSANNVNVGAIVGGVIAAVVVLGGLAALLVFYLLKVRKGKAYKTPIEKVAEETVVVDPNAQAPADPEPTKKGKGTNRSPRSKGSKKSKDINDNLENSNNKAKDGKEATLILVKETGENTKPKKKGKGKGKAKAKAKKKKNATNPVTDDEKDDQDMEPEITEKPTQIDSAKDSKLEDTEKAVVFDEKKGTVEKGDDAEKEKSKKDTLMMNGHVKEPTLIKDEPMRNGTIMNGHVKEPTLIKDEPMRNGTMMNGHAKEPTLIKDEPFRSGTVLSLVDVETNELSVIPDTEPAKKKGKGKGKQKKITAVKEAESKQEGETGKNKGKKKKSKKGKGKKK